MSLLILEVFALLATATAANWAVLVAGSNGWYNYRHQADVCHSYQLLRNKGFPESNIITFLYDDIAFNPANKFPGKIFHSVDSSVNVYDKVKIDYKGDNVNAKVFLNVLIGDSNAVSGVGSGKVLNSTEMDNVFIYYTDHGAFGSIGMPTGPFVFADELNRTLTTMQERKMFNKLVFYLDSCNSGSVFDQFLRNDGKVFAFTASKPNQVSLAVRYSAKLGTFLADEFSANWIEDTEAHLALSEYTIGQQVQIVVNSTIQSKAQKYGDMSLLKMRVDDFQGFESEEVLGLSNIHDERIFRTIDHYGDSSRDGVSTRDVTLEILKLKMEQESVPSKLESLRNEYEKEVARRIKYDRIFAKISEQLAGSPQKLMHPRSDKGPENFECLRQTVQFFTENCMSLDEYGMSYIETLATLCDMSNVLKSNIADAIQQSCSSSN